MNINSVFHSIVEIMLLFLPLFSSEFNIVTFS